MRIIFSEWAQARAALDELQVTNDSGLLYLVQEGKTKDAPTGRWNHNWTGRYVLTDALTDERCVLIAGVQQP
jgi:hypothetical protein